MKYLILILFLFIGCEKPDLSDQVICKECIVINEFERFVVFVCGEELKKYESNPDAICLKISCKD